MSFFNGKGPASCTKFQLKTPAIPSNKVVQTTRAKTSKIKANINSTVVANVNKLAIKPSATRAKLKERT